jgi:hypothetical protein
MASKQIVLAAIVVALVSTCLAEDATFKKVRYWSVKQPKESDVVLTITDSKILIKGENANKDMAPINFEIPYSAIESLTSERSERHRVSEGLLVGGVITASTKTKSHWLDIEYHGGDAKQVVTLHLDKTEYEDVISTLEARTGKRIDAVESKSSSFNPIAESKDMDEVIPFKVDAIVAALKAAMDSVGCDVKKASAKRVECKRARSYGKGTERAGVGGEKVTAELKPKGDQTRVRLSTEKGMLGRIYKKNWSTPIFLEMMKKLQKPSQTASAPSN